MRDASECGIGVRCISALKPQIALLRHHHMTFRIGLDLLNRLANLPRDGSANAQLLPVVTVQHVSIAVAPLDDPNHTPFP